MKRFQLRSVCAVAALFAFLSLGPAACGGDADPADDRQETVDREMDMALEDRAAEPELRDEPQAEAPARQASPQPQPAQRRQTPPPPPARAEPDPAPALEEPVTEPAAPPEPEPVTLSAPAGTTFRVELAEELNTKTNRVGDAFTVRLLDPITDGRVVVAPAESIVRGKVTALQKSGGSGEPAVIKVDFQDIFVGGEYFPVRATVVEANPETRGRSGTGEKAAKIGGGAVAGAILGRVVGGNAKGAVIGAAVGAAAGTAITLVTEDRDAVLPAGSRLTLALDEPLLVTIYR